jgi:uncharacterized protein YqhQ
MSVGMQAIRIALHHASGIDITAQQMKATLTPVFIGAVAVFVVAPGIMSSPFDGWVGDVMEAVGRVLVLVVYLLAISRSPQTKRLFGYHGAEHMAIAAFERAGRLPSTDEVMRESPVHVRCGTNFIALFVISAGVIFAFVPRDPMWLGGLLRFVLAPAVAAVAYEVMRAGARWPNEFWARGVTWAGRALQRITTRHPEADQVEIALAALGGAIDDRFTGSPGGRN